MQNIQDNHDNSFSVQGLQRHQSLNAARSAMTFDQWREQAQMLNKRADKVREMILNRARKDCKDAGLDPTLLGIHPHNAMCSFDSGKPWPGVDYSLVRRCIWLQRKAWEPSRIAGRIIDRAWHRYIAA